MLKIRHRLIIVYFLATLFACGPRTGVHNDEVNQGCGNVTLPPSKEISVSTSDQRHGKELFKRNCAVCHAYTDAKVTGPGMRNILDRLPSGESYFRRYVANSDSLVRTSDAYALKLQSEYDIDYSHRLGDYPLSSEDLENLVAFIKVINRPVP